MPFDPKARKRKRSERGRKGNEREKMEIKG
jgi:hypothetical protein